MNKNQKEDFNMKKLFLLTTLIILSFALFIQAVSASEYVLINILTEEMTENFAAEKYHINVNQSSKNYTYLISWTSSIIHINNRNIVIEGTTRTSSNVDKLSTRTYLQKYNSDLGAWQNLDNILNTEYNTNYSYSGGAYIVSPGEYRALTTHSAANGSLQESTTSISQSIIIQ